MWKSSQLGTHFFARLSLSAWVILLPGLCLSGLAFYVLDSRAEREARQKIETHIKDITEALDKRIDAYAGIVYGLRGFFNASEDVTRLEFKRYVESLAMQRRFPGLVYLSFARYVPARREQAFLERVRRDTSRHPDGYPDFRIFPTGARSEYVVIEFIEPEEEYRLAIGRDLSFTEPVYDNAQALRLTRDSGQLVTSGRLAQLDSASAINTPAEPVALPLWLATYKPGMPLDTLWQRREAYTGTVGGAILLGEVLREVIPPEALQSMRIRLYDVDSPASGADVPPTALRLFIDVSALLAADDLEQERQLARKIWFQQKSPLEFGGRRWLLYFDALEKPAITVPRLFVWGTLVGGVIISVLFAGLVQSLVTSRSRALRMAAEITGDLRKSKTILAEAERIAHLGNWSLDLAEKTMEWSEETYRIIGLPPRRGAFSMEVALRHVHEQDRHHFRRLMRAAPVSEQGFETELRFIGPDGNTRWAQVAAKVYPDRSGRPRWLRGTMMDITAHKELLEKVRHLAYHDELTSLPNRAYFYDCFQRALAQTERYGKMLALLFVDIDRFKNINDTLGHDAGDRLLQDLSNRLMSCLRKGDTLARFGGDEFVVLLEEMRAPETAGTVAHNLLRAVAAPFTLNDMEYHFTASIGISLCPQDGGDIHTLLKHADIAMYRAKDEGKNSYCFYSERMSEQSVERVAMESSLHRALENRELLLLYQPFIDARSGAVTGAEALLRWMHPTMGLIAPTRFIPLAEETGLIVPIGEWVLQRACEQGREWGEQGRDDLRISVNLSARQFRQNGLLESVTTILDTKGLRSSNLELEITESTIMGDPDRAIGVLEKFKQRGIRLSLDDFGTGYSSLSYFKRFPIDTVKIDRSFVSGIPNDADDLAIVRAVIAMAHTLGLGVVAEGVETREQFSVLNAEACDTMQGFLFHRPLTVDEFSKLLRQRPFSVIESV